MGMPMAQSCLLSRHGHGQALAGARANAIGYGNVNGRAHGPCPWAMAMDMAKTIDAGKAMAMPRDKATPMAQVMPMAKVTSIVMPKNIILAYQKLKPASCLTR